MKACFLLGIIGCAFAQYETQPSGYGSNNAREVQGVAMRSPQNEPVDYTSNALRKQSKGGHQVEKKFTNQQDGSDIAFRKNVPNNKQKLNARLAGGSQKFNTTSGSKSNKNRKMNQNGANNIGRSNGNVHSIDVDKHDGLKIVPSYRPNYGGYQPNDGRSQPASSILDNKLDLENFGPVNSQGQSSGQIAREQLNALLNQNVANVGHPTSNEIAGYRPSYDAPNYGGISGGAIIIPVLRSYAGGSNLIGNKINEQTLGEINKQGQANYRQRDGLTNVGTHTEVNVGLHSGQGRTGAGNGRPSYDAPSYGEPIYIPNFNNFLRNNVYTQNFEKINSQRQSNYQLGEAHANFGRDTHEMNVGQINNQNAGGKAANYDAPSHGGYQSNVSYGADNPTFNMVGYRYNQQNLSQQRQSNAKIGDTRTNVGSNQNTINDSHFNNYNVGESNKGYEAPKHTPVPEPENPYRRRH